MPYQSTPEDIRRAYTIGAVYLLLAILLGAGLFWIWPPIPWPVPDNEEGRERIALYVARADCKGNAAAQNSNSNANSNANSNTNSNTNRDSNTNTNANTNAATNS